MESTNESNAEQQLSKSVLSRYFEENNEEPLDYEIEPWDTSSDIDYDSIDEHEEENEEYEAEEDEGFVFESQKPGLKLIRDGYKRKLKNQGKPKIVFSETSTGYVKPGPLLKSWKYRLSCRKRAIHKHRTTSQDDLFSVILKQKKAPWCTRKQMRKRLKHFIVVKNENCGRQENLEFTFHQWHHFVVPFGPDVFVTPLRSVEEIYEESSAKSCGEVTDALNDEERSVRDLRVTLAKIETEDGTLERLFDGVCLTNVMFNKCQEKGCTCKHYLGEEFEKRLSALNSFDSLKIAYQFTKKCYVFRSVYKSFIKLMAKLKERQFMAKNMVEDILQQFVIKHEVGIRKVILGLVSTGLQFYEAVHFVMQENDISDTDLSDSLLKIIALHHNLAQNWFLVQLLIEKRNEMLPSKVTQSLIEICVMQPVPNVELAKNVLKDLIVDQNISDTKEIPSSIYSELVIQASK